MTIFTGFSLFGYISSQSKHEQLRKNIKPLSSAILRQPFSSSPRRQTIKSNRNNTNHYRYQHDSTFPPPPKPEVITENSILSNFPRPNLMPTLHFSLFGYNNNEHDRTNRPTSLCSNCSGPHSTDYCPC